MPGESELRRGLWTIRSHGSTVNPKAQEILDGVIRGFIKRRVKPPPGILCDGAFSAANASMAATDAKYEALTEIAWRRGAAAAEAKDAPLRVVFVDDARPHYEIHFRENTVCSENIDEATFARVALFAVANLIGGKPLVIADDTALPEVSDYPSGCAVYDFEAFRNGRK